MNYARVCVCVFKALGTFNFILACEQGSIRVGVKGFTFEVFLRFLELFEFERLVCYLLFLSCIWFGKLIWSNLYDSLAKLDDRWPNGLIIGIARPRLFDDVRFWICGSLSAFLVYPMTVELLGTFLVVRGPLFSLEANELCSTLPVSLNTSHFSSELRVTLSVLRVLSGVLLFKDSK